MSGQCGLEGVRITLWVAMVSWKVIRDSRGQIRVMEGGWGGRAPLKSQFFTKQSMMGCYSGETKGDSKTKG